eukprot:761975-Hanusia_phi.AAC.2
MHQRPALGAPPRLAAPTVAIPQVRLGEKFSPSRDRTLAKSTCTPGARLSKPWGSDQMTGGGPLHGAWVESACRGGWF